MNQHKIDFLESGCPLLLESYILKVIEKAIHAHTQDNTYWVKLYPFSASIKIDMFNKLQEDQDKVHV